MIIIDKFLGQRVEILEDRRYHTPQGLWGRIAEQAIEFGLTQPALVLSGGILDVDWLADDSGLVSAGETVILVIAGKPMYLETPLSGTIRFNKALLENPAQIAADPYGSGWIFRIEPVDDMHASYENLSEAKDYLERLKDTEGFKNPEGIKGGVSGICKAVYSSIREQKI